MTNPPFVPLQFERVSLHESHSRAQEFYERLGFSSPGRLMEFELRDSQ